MLREPTRDEMEWSSFIDDNPMYLGSVEDFAKMRAREREDDCRRDRAWALERRETQERMAAADKRQRELDAQSDRIARRVIIGALALVLALVWALW